MLREEFIENPNDWRIQYHTGFAWRIIGDMEKSIFSYKRAIQLCPANESAGHMNYYGLGIVYQLIGDFDIALDNLRKAYQLDKTSVQVLNSLGLTYKKKDNLEKAIEIYNFACETLMNNIMRELESEGHRSTFQDPNDEKAAILNNELFNLIPGKLKEDIFYCTLQNNIAVCHAMLGQKEEARKAFREAITFTPEGSNYEAPIIGLKQLDDE